MELKNAIGRRKSAIARIYMNDGKGAITVNNKEYKEYFTTPHLQYSITQPLAVSGSEGKYDIKAIITGGGIKGQAEALRLAIARMLVEINPETKASIKANGFLTRDPREVERKKPGQPKARKRFQFSKR